MVITDFQIEEKTSRLKFFQNIILVADTKFEVILGMLFLKISNINMSFDKKILI